MKWHSIGSSNNALLPDRCRAITWTNAGLLSIGLLRTNFSEIWIIFNHENIFESVVCQIGGHFVQGRVIKKLMSVCTLKQNIGRTSCDFKSIKSNRNMSRSDWKYSPVHKYRLNQSKRTFPRKSQKMCVVFFPMWANWLPSVMCVLVAFSPLERRKSP